MRIIIETGGAEGLTVSQEAAGESSAVMASGAAAGAGLEAMDGGGPPDHLVEMLTGEPEDVPEEAEDEASHEPGDAGGAPAWLVEVIEGSEAGTSGDYLSEDE